MIGALLTLALGLAWQQPESLETHFEGLSALTARDLLRAAVDEQADLVRNGFRRAEVDDMAFRMESHARDQGFPFARVRWDYRIAGSVLHATFKVEEGPRTRLGEITLEGNLRFSQEELQPFLVPSATTRLEGRPLFLSSRVAAAPGAISSLYRGHGYLDVEVPAPQIEFREERSVADVHLVVHEGPCFRVAAIRFDGNQSLRQTDLETLTAGMVGKPFFPRQAFDLGQRVSAAYADRGYAGNRVVVERALDRNTGAVNLQVVIDEGPLVEIGEVRIVGELRTREDFILQRLALLPGARYDRRLEQKSFRQLYRTGLFRRVDLSLTGDGAVRDLQVELEEGMHKELTLEPGYGSYEKLRFKLGWRDKNLFGSGRVFRAEGSASMKSVGALVGVTDPWFLGSEIELDTPLFFRRRQEPSFNREEAGLAAQFRWRQSRRLSWLWGYRISRTRVNSESAGLPADILADDATLASVFAGPRYDTRNDYFNPTRGGFHSLQFEYGSSVLGGEVDYLRSELTLSHFQPLNQTASSALALGLRSQVVVPTGDTDEVPLQLRVFNGGENSVRAFRESRLGPVDALGEPLGGEVATSLSVEWRQRLRGALWSGLFLDYGNVALDASAPFEDFRPAVGAGLRYLVPVGALRLDFGLNPERRPGEDKWLIHLSVGMAF